MIIQFDSGVRIVVEGARDTVSISVIKEPGDLDKNKIERNRFRVNKREAKVLVSALEEECKVK
jgi:hypothetical protein